MTRTNPNPSSVARLRLVLLLAATLALGGCAWYLYPAEPLPSLLAFENFYGDEFQQNWDFGVTPGNEFSAWPANGRLEVHGPGHYLRSKASFPTTVTVLLEWSAINGNAEAQTYPLPVNSESDFSVLLLEPGVSVQLSLYRPDPILGTVDILRIRDVFGRDAVSPVIVQSTGATRGIFEVNFAMKGEELMVDARAPELGLLANTPVTTSGSEESEIRIETSGLPRDPRFLETLYVYEEIRGPEVLR